MTDIICTRYIEISRIGEMSIRQVHCTPPWFDVYYGRADAALHIYGTLSLADAFSHLTALLGDPKQ